MRRLLLLIVVLAALPASARAAGPTCDAGAARAAVTASEPLEEDIRATGAVMPDQAIFDVFEVGRLICHDLTGDRRREMTVLLECCTPGSPTPLAIFRPRGDRWRLAYRTTRPLISSVKRDGRRLRVRTPVYRRTDPRCCPSTYKRWTIRYADGAFERHSRAST